MSKELRNSDEYAVTVQTLGMNPSLDHDTITEVVDDVFRTKPEEVRDEIIAEVEKDLGVSQRS